MVRIRQAKIDGISVPDLEVDDPTGDAELLLIGWGSSYGPIGEACRRARRKGIKVAHAHLRYLSPFPANLGDVLRRYPQVVCPEMNLGQLAMLLRAQVPGRRAIGHQGPGSRVPGRRSGPRHPRRAGRDAGRDRTRQSDGRQNGGGNGWSGS